MITSDTCWLCGEVCDGCEPDSEMLSLLATEPAESMGYYDWEEQQELFEHGPLTDEDVRAKRACEMSMLAAIWAERRAA